MRAGRRMAGARQTPKTWPRWWCRPPRPRPRRASQWRMHWDDKEEPLILLVPVRLEPVPVGEGWGWRGIFRPGQEGPRCRDRRSGWMLPGWMLPVSRSRSSFGSCHAMVNKPGLRNRSVTVVTLDAGARLKAGTIAAGERRARVMLAGEINRGNQFECRHMSANSAAGRARHRTPPTAPCRPRSSARRCSPGAAPSQATVGDRRPARRRDRSRACRADRPAPLPAARPR